MNTHDYILSGILEQYVLGDVSAQEKQEVECLSKIYPEIKAEIQNIENNLEQFALDNAITPPDDSKIKLFEQITFEQNNTSANPISTTQTVDKSQSEYIPNTPLTVSRNNYMKAASVLLIIGLSGIVAFLFSHNQQRKHELSNLMNSNKQLNQQLASLTTEMKVATDPYNKSIALKANEKANQQTMQIYWNTSNAKVYISKVNFPKLSADKQYQLWALKDGKPIDLGVFDAEDELHEMKAIDGLQSFAVTIEKAGGNPTPTLSELCAIVNI